jgi:hypothetical protein
MKTKVKAAQCPKTTGGNQFAKNSMRNPEYNIWSKPVPAKTHTPNRMIVPRSKGMLIRLEKNVYKIIKKCAKSHDKRGGSAAAEWGIER